MYLIIVEDLQHKTTVSMTPVMPCHVHLKRFLQSYNSRFSSLSFAENVNFGVLSEITECYEVH